MRQGHEGCKPLRRGTIVRHHGQQYPGAHDGTAKVVRSFRRGVWLEYVVEALPGASPFGSLRQSGDRPERSADDVVEIGKG